jgi:error-prone DNA polymerase
LGQARRDLLWELGGLVYSEEGMDIEVPIESVTLPALSPAERLGWERELLRMTPGDHVMSLYRETLQTRGVLTSPELQDQRDGRRVRVAGRVVVRQRPPSAKGFVFITLEDEYGLMNLIIRPKVYDHYRHTLRAAPLLIAEGVVQREGTVTNLLVWRAAAIPMQGALP